MVAVRAIRFPHLVIVSPLNPSQPHRPPATQNHCSYKRTLTVSLALEVFAALLYVRYGSLRLRGAQLKGTPLFLLEPSAMLLWEAIGSNALALRSAQTLFLQ